MANCEYSKWETSIFNKTKSFGFEVYCFYVESNVKINHADHMLSIRPQRWVRTSVCMNLCTAKVCNSKNPMEMCSLIIPCLFSDSN